jgi:hypothetical protein
LTNRHEYGITVLSLTDLFQGKIPKTDNIRGGFFAYNKSISQIWSKANEGEK